MRTPRAQKRFAVKKVNWALCVLGCLGRCRMQIHISSPEATWVLHWYYMGTTWALPVKYHLWTKFGTCSIDFQGPMDHRPTTGPLPQPMLSDHEKSFAGDPPQVQVEWRHLDSRKEMIGMTRQDCINLYLVFVVFLAHTNHKTFHSCKWVWECKSRFKGRTKLDTVSSRKEWRRFHRMQKIGPASRFPWVPMSSQDSLMIFLGARVPFGPQWNPLGSALCCSNMCTTPRFPSWANWHGFTWLHMAWHGLTIPDLSKRSLKAKMMWLKLSGKLLQLLIVYTHLPCMWYQCSCRISNMCICRPSLYTLQLCWTPAVGDLLTAPVASTCPSALLRRHVDWEETFLSVALRCDSVRLAGNDQPLTGIINRFSEATQPIRAIGTETIIEYQSSIRRRVNELVFETAVNGFFPSQNPRIRDAISIWSTGSTNISPTNAKLNPPNIESEIRIWLISLGWFLAWSLRLMWGARYT